MQHTVSRGGSLVKIGRFNEPLEEIRMRSRSTVGDVLDELEIELNDSESVWCNGDEAELDAVVQDGDILNIVVKKSHGSEEEETPAEEAK